MRGYFDPTDTALRVAWLRVHADLLRDADPTGQLTANLRDFADLLEHMVETGVRR